MVHARQVARCLTLVETLVQEVFLNTPLTMAEIEEAGPRIGSPEFERVRRSLRVEASPQP